MKYVVRADGSTKIGTGHIFRTLAIARQLKALHHSVVYLCRPLIPALKQRLMKENIEIKDIADPQAFESEINVVTEMLEKENCQWVIVDHYDVNEEYYVRLREKGRKVLAIDDINHTKFPVDILLNQNIFAEKIAYESATFTKHFMGPSYALMDPVYPQQRNTAHIRTSLRKVLIFMGGADVSNITLRMFKSIEASRKSLDVDIVVGGGYQFDEELSKATAQSKLKVKIYKDLPSLAELILQADLAICAGGSTCWQMCTLFLPMLLVSVADNQIKIAQGLAQAGAGIDMGGLDLSEDKVTQIIDALKDTDIKSMSEKAGSICDGRGVERLIHEIS